MYIHSIHIENFGRLHDFDMAFDNTLHVLRTENGWGKSTLAAFIKAMFYGLDYTAKRSLEQNERRKYLPWQGGAFGGSLVFSAGGRSYRAERFFGSRDKEDTYALYDLDTGLASADFSVRLGEELFLVDREAFERSCCFVQKKLTVFINDSLGARLACPGEETGDMAGYEKAAVSLEKRIKYYKKTGSRGRIGVLEERRRRVQAELADCRVAEKAMDGWQPVLLEKRQEEKQLADRLKALKAQLGQIQKLGEAAAKKAQYDLLKTQAAASEERLREAAGALGRFEHLPLDDETLDRCGGWIHELGAARQQEEGAAGELAGIRRRLAKLEKLKERIPAANRLLLGGFCLLAFLGSIFLLIRWLLPGILCLAFGLWGAMGEFGRVRRAKGQAQELEQELLREKQALKKADTAYRMLQKKRSCLEQKVCRALSAADGTDSRELEDLWKRARLESREYQALKVSYENGRQEAKRSKEAYLAYQAQFSEEELGGLLKLQKLEQEVFRLQEAVKECRRRQEELQNEQRSLYGQERSLQEKAERIPQLLEEASLVSEELEKAVREHRLLEKTLEYLTAAREKLGLRYIEELRQGTEHYLELLAPKGGPRPFLDVKLTLRAEEAGAIRDLEYISSGWQDLLQIAERMAVIDALYKKEQPALLLDDPFINLDEEKQKRAFSLLEKMSEKRQILYFTCR